MGTRDIEVTLRLRATSEGGRSNPAFTGYRPQFYYDGRDWDAEHEYIDVDEVAPGETARAYLRFGCPAHHDGRVTVGMKFELREGARVIGEGVVVRILDLPQSAARQRSESDRNWE